MSTELKLKDIKGIGAVAVTKLNKAGIKTPQDLAAQSLESLTEAIGCSKEVANDHIMAANDLLREHDIIGKEFVDGNEALEAREKLLKLKIGAEKFDAWLMGGFETGAITELYGEFGSGKSQFCHTLCMQVSKPIEEGGLAGDVIVIDTESTFRPERLKQIVTENGLDPKEVLSHVHVCKVFNSGHLEAIVRNMAEYIETWKARMIIVDSIIALHRSDFSGRGTLADRQQRLNSLMHRLLRLAEIYNIAVIITNQVTAAPDTFFGDPTKPTGGHIVGHNATYRLYLKKAGKIRKAKMVDSPCHPITECPFNVEKKGIVDVEVKDE